MFHAYCCGPSFPRDAREPGPAMEDVHVISSQEAQPMTAVSTDGLFEPAGPRDANGAPGHAQPSLLLAEYCFPPPPVASHLAPEPTTNRECPLSPASEKLPSSPITPLLTPRSSTSSSDDDTSSSSSARTGPVKPTDHGVVDPHQPMAAPTWADESPSCPEN